MDPGLMPDTMRVNDTTHFMFYPIALGIPYNSAVGVSYTLTTSYGNIIDTDFAHFSHVTYEAYYTALMGSGYYTTLAFSPTRIGTYHGLLILNDPSGTEDIYPDSLKFTIVVIDALPGSYCLISPAAIDFGKANRNGQLYSSFNIKSPFYSTKPLSINIEGPFSPAFQYWTGSQLSVTIPPGFLYSANLVASAPTPGIYRDTIRIYTNASRSSDTVIIPMWFEVRPDNAVQNTQSDNNPIKLNIWPNPISGEATLSFVLDQPSPMLLEIYDVLGNRKKVIANDIYESGKKDFVLNTKDLQTGSYFVRLKTGDKIIIQKILVY